MPPSVFCVANIVKFVALVKIIDLFFNKLPRICSVDSNCAKIYTTGKPRQRRIACCVLWSFLCSETDGTLL